MIDGFNFTLLAWRGFKGFHQENKVNKKKEILQLCVRWF